MKSSTSDVCTLFEGGYHPGVGALANSLHACGFRGTLWVGFRGDLPPWAPSDASGSEAGMPLPDGMRLRFVPLETSDHLTNHKPDFMLRVADLAPAATRFLYLDPDIVVRAPWAFFEDWMDAGVASVEDVNSPLDDSHPRRASWRKYYEPRGLALRTRTPVYVNGGCLGVARGNLGFLTLWRDIQLMMAEAIGGLGAANIGGGQMKEGQGHPGFCFNKTDQDALNVAMMAWNGEISVMGREAMDFAPGGYVMSHALGAPKPWAKSYFRCALDGFPPTRADKEFWNHVSTPIPVFSPAVARRRGAAMAAASFLGRFYHRQ